MPQFFFHMESKRTQLRDEKGKNLSDLGAAHEHAMHMVYRTLCAVPAEDTEGWMIKIATPDGQTPLTVLFPRRYFSARTGAYEPLSTDATVVR